MSNSDETAWDVHLAIVKISTPLILTGFFIMFAEQINYIFVGDLENTNAIAAVGLGNMIINLIALSVSFGMNCAMETLVSQAHGAHNLRLCGVILNRGRAMLLVMFVPIAILLYCTPWILKGLGQDEEISQLAGGYVRTLLPGIFCIMQFDAHKTLLNGMAYTLVPTTIQAFAIPMHLFWAHMFVGKWGYGIVGTCYALDITYFTLLCGILLYCSFFRDI
jgi:MATE family multidrug resistance protein